MRGLQVSINGKLLYSIGVGDFGHMSAGVDWARIAQHRGTIYEHLWVQANTQIDAPETARHWQNHRLEIGDEVTIKVVEIDAPDDPLPGLPDFPATISPK